MGSDTCHQHEPLCPWGGWGHLGIPPAPLQDTHSQVHEHVSMVPLKPLQELSP